MGKTAKLRYDDQHPEYLGLVMTDKNRWEYQQVVDWQSHERAIRLAPPGRNPKVLPLIPFPMNRQKNTEKPDAFLKQFDDLKKKHPDALLLFRRNDFYEIYGRMRSRLPPYFCNGNHQPDYSGRKGILEK